MTFNNLKFLTDENIDPELVEFLRSKGFDVIDIKELALDGSKDVDILNYAHSVKRVVITHDDDFGKIIYTQNTSFTGIVYIRPGHFFVEFYIAAFENLLTRNLEYAPPFILVVEVKEGYFKIRLRNWS
jgi:predicted nuclease of predicted toxin-antitoxin system